MLTSDGTDVKGAVLEEGVRATCAVAALGGSALLVGTDRGTVVSFVRDGDGGEKSAWVPVCQYALHHGPVYHLSLSVTHLVCSAGHDARCCLFPLAAVFSSPAGDDTQDGQGSDGQYSAEWRWVEAHSLPVVHTCFLSDGYTVLSVDIGGVLVRSQLTDQGVATHDKIACGFPGRLLALSLDETSCFVGGAGLACVDLQGPFRPLDAFNTATAAPPNQPGSAARSGANTSSLTALTHLDASGSEAALPTPGTVVCRLSVSRLDGSVRAEFSPTPTGRATSELPVAAAEWRVDHPKWYVALSYTTLTPSTSMVRPSRALSAPLVIRHHSHTTRAGITGSHQRWPSVLTSRIVLRPASRPLSGVESRPTDEDVASFSALLRLPYSSAQAAAAHTVSPAQSRTIATTPAERLVAAQERNKQLREQCSELAQTLKALMEQRKRNKKTKLRA